MYCLSLQKSDIPITEAQLDDLVALMDKNGNGEIELGYIYYFDIFEAYTILEGKEDPQ